MRYVVIGASAAGISAVKKLRELNSDAEIILVSKDENVYSRCILYHYLVGDRTMEEMNFAGLDFEKGLNLRWIKGIAVKTVNTAEKCLTLEDGQRIDYDRVCIATGACTNFPPIPGLLEAKNVIGFRNLEDVEKIKQCLPRTKNIFVLGAGLVGIDVIAGLLKYEKHMFLADMGPYMMPIQLDEHSAGVYQTLFEKAGVEQYYKTGAKELLLDDDGNCYKVILSNGIEKAVDLVINCAGVRANTEFLNETGIAYDKQGLLIDLYGQTNIPDVYGAGDVTGRAPVWPVAVKEGAVAAYSMSGYQKNPEEYFAMKSSMHFFDIPTLSIGNVNQYDDTYDVQITDDKDGNYKKLVCKNGIIVGALLQGDLSDSGKLAEQIRLKEKIV